MENHKSMFQKLGEDAVRREALIDYVNKGPLGVIPQFLWREQRIVDLLAAIERFKAVGREPNEEWAEEVATHRVWLELHFARIKR